MAVAENDGKGRGISSGKQQVKWNQGEGPREKKVSHDKSRRKGKESEGVAFGLTRGVRDKRGKAKKTRQREGTKIIA